MRIFSRIRDWGFEVFVWQRDACARMVELPSVIAATQAAVFGHAVGYIRPAMRAVPVDQAKRAASVL